MSDKLWQAVGAALSLATRAIEEVRAGKPGRVPPAIEWQEGVHYEGAVVAHLGQSWQARRDTGQAPPHADWVCLAAAGTDGRSFRIRGTWAAEEAYRALDVVALQNASFAARVDNPGPCPGPDWQLIAAQGKQGKPGERGAKGERGEAGPGLGLVAATVDDEGLLTLVNADGSTVTCDFYPVLARR